jgi:hypothetical protein
MSDEAIVSESVSEEAAPAEISEEVVQEEAAPAPKKYKVKVDGSEMEVEEDELVRSYSHARASADRMKQAAEERKAAADERKKAEDLYQKFKSKPFEVMAELGLDPRTMSEEFLLEMLNEESLTPEQKKQREMEKKLKTYEEKEVEREKSAKEQKEREEMTAKERELADLTDKTHKEYETQFIEALEKTSLPRTPTTIRRVAEVVYQNAVKGVDISVDHALRIVEGDIRSGLSETLKGLDGDSLISFLGEDTVKKIRKYEVSKVKNPTPKQTSVVAEPKEDKGPASPDEWLKRIKKEHGILT